MSSSSIFRHKVSGSRGHVLPKAPEIDINNPGRLRTANVLAICGISHSTLYSRMAALSFPKPDGKDGGLLYWNTATIREYLQGSSAGVQA
jgi:predicted DNA-binding transcriptional regulator AlpA